MSADWCFVVQKALECVNSSPCQMTYEESVDISSAFVAKYLATLMCLFWGDSWSYL